MYDGPDKYPSIADKGSLVKSHWLDNCVNIQIDFVRREMVPCSRRLNFTGRFGIGGAFERFHGFFRFGAAFIGNRILHWDEQI